jgi:NADP-dependent 3-hydroxy acid dehydrogenase YdfG
MFFLEEKWTNSVLNTKLDDIRKAYDTNTFGPLILIQQIVPIMKNNKYGRIVNMSSGAGTFFFLFHHSLSQIYIWILILVL